MKFENELLKLSIGLADGKAYRTLTSYNVGQLQAFYCSLNQEERRIRFGAAVSDESIASYCEQIDWRSTLVIAFGDAHRLHAVATNVRIDIQRIENATVATKAGEEAVATLLRLSAIATSEVFAAGHMLVNLDGAHWLIRHLREVGPATLLGDHADFDVTAISGEISVEDRRVQRWRTGRVAAAASSCGQ